jgi:hypothetical protein
MEGKLFVLLVGAGKVDKGTLLEATRNPTIYKIGRGIFFAQTTDVRPATPEECLRKLIRGN